jgi:hypothetical protein
MHPPHWPGADARQVLDRGRLAQGADQPCHQPPDRKPDRLVQQEVHQDRPPLPHIEIQAGDYIIITATDRCPTISMEPSTASTAIRVRAN